MFEAKKEHEREEKGRRWQREALQAQASLPGTQLQPRSFLIITWVARLSNDVMKNGKLKDIIAPLKNAIKITLPLVEYPRCTRANHANVRIPVRHRLITSY
ncbi:hypothetical protein [Bradyrhizobium sp. USDA 4506]